MLNERERPKKKPFQTPELIVYGDIREITLAVGKFGAADGGKGQNKTAK